MNGRADLTAKRLRELLHYSPETGEFTRRITTGNFGRWRAGSVAGGANIVTGYWEIGIGKHVYHGHRLAWLWMTGEWPRQQIDHVDHNTSNNCWQNLREATPLQNNWNSDAPITNASGFKGVSRAQNKQRTRWCAHIRVNGKSTYLGVFDTPERAFIAYIFAAWRHFGDFARIDADYLRAIRNLADLSTYPEYARSR